MSTPMKKPANPSITKSQIWFWCLLTEIAIKRRSLNGCQPRGEVWENLVLIKAADEKEAYEKALRLGNGLNGDCSGSLRLDGDAAVSKFLGVQDMGLLTDGTPHDGGEILFSIRRETLAKAKSRIRGKKVLPALAKAVAGRKRGAGLKSNHISPLPPRPSAI